MSRRFRAQWTRVCAILALVSLFLIWTDNPDTWPRITPSKAPDGNVRIASKLPAPQGFQPFEVHGFVNLGEPWENSCNSLRHTGELYAEKHQDVNDDIHAIAESLKEHPMVDYSTQDGTLSHKEIVEKTWLRMAQSSVWLKRYGVYLTVTRVAFYTKGVRHWPLISFLRAQIHDRDWKELHDYDIHWQGETIRFPRILNIPAPYVIGEAFFGPEDPRIIVEDHPDAEPVIIFNMLYDTENLYRAMFITRPFSNVTTILRIAGGDPEHPEKNWMPFVYKEQPARNALAGLGMSDYHELPTRHLHFIYDFRPLRILKCDLLTGWCDWAYQQKAPDSLKGLPKDTGAVFRGGTNLVAFRSHNGVQTFIGLPKSNVRVGCGEAVYRPSILVLTAASPSLFHVDYMSDSVEFGDQALIPMAKSDPCGEGRIMMANSIAKWDRSAGKDLMTITYTVDDVTTQTLRIHGMEAFVDSIPYHSRLRLSRSESTADVDTALFDRQDSDLSYHVLSCSVEAAEIHAFHLAEETNFTDLRKIRFEKANKLLADE